MDDKRSPLVLSVKEARRQLGLSRGLMYEALRSGQIPSIRIGRRILIPRAALKRMLDRAAEDSPADGEEGNSRD